jgi:hypothetical protein
VKFASFREINTRNSFLKVFEPSSLFFNAYFVVCCMLHSCEEFQLMAVMGCMTFNLVFYSLCDFYSSNNNNSIIIIIHKVV